MCVFVHLSPLQAVRNLNPLICRFYFLDGKAKAMGVSPTSTATDVIRGLAEKIELQTVEGWALYEVYTPPYYEMGIISTTQRFYVYQRLFCHSEAVVVHLQLYESGSLLKQFLPQLFKCLDETLELCFLFSGQS